MKLRQIGFVFAEAFRGVRENALMSMASVTTVTVALTLLALFLLVALNLQYLTVVVESQVELVAFLDGEFVRDEWQSLLVEKVQAIPGVTNVEYVTKEEALDTLKGQFGERSDLLETMEGDSNPLRDSVRVQAEDPSMIPAIAEEVQRLDSVTEVKFGTEVIDRIVQFSDMLQQGGLILIGVMIVTTILLVANTTRLTVFARRQEIYIMRLVGASNGIIHWPFVLEGVLLGLIGAVVAAGLSWYAYTLVSAEISYALPFFPVLPQQPMLTNMAKLLLGSGILLGAFGSTVSVRRYLKA